MNAVELGYIGHKLSLFCALLTVGRRQQLDKCLPGIYCWGRWASHEATDSKIWPAKNCK